MNGDSEPFLDDTFILEADILLYPLYWCYHLASTVIITIIMCYLNDNSATPCPLSCVQ